MPTDDEVQRLREVYHNYSESRVVQARWSGTNPGNQAIIQERTRVLRQMLHASDFSSLADCRVLDIGCGSGQVLASFIPWGALPHNLYGIDLLPEEIEVAKKKFPEIHFQYGNAEQFDFRDGSFDLVLLFTVFTSILDNQMATNVAEEVRRVLKPSGAVVWYDFRYNNPFNPNVRGMTKKAIHGLFPDFSLYLRTITLLPHLARRLGCMTSILYPALSVIPFLRTHYIGLLVKPP